METTQPSAIRTLNYALITFLIALSSMVLLYQWATGG